MPVFPCGSALRRRAGARRCPRVPLLPRGVRGAGGRAAVPAAPALPTCPTCPRRRTRRRAAAAGAGSVPAARAATGARGRRRQRPVPGQRFGSSRRPPAASLYAPCLGSAGAPFVARDDATLLARAPRLPDDPRPLSHSNWADCVGCVRRASSAFRRTLPPGVSLRRARGAGRRVPSFVTSRLAPRPDAGPGRALAAALLSVDRPGRAGRRPPRAGGNRRPAVRGDRQAPDTRR